MGNLRQTAKTALYYAGLLGLAYRVHQWNDSRKRLKAIHRDWANAVRLVHETLTKAGVGYYADFGTLLGIVRERGYVPHDLDMDFSIPAGEDAEKARAALRETELLYWRRFEYGGRMVLFSFFFRGVPIDFYVREATSRGLAHYDFIPEYDARHLAVASWRARREFSPAPSGYVEAEALGARVRIPANADEILTACYGNWRVPDKGWNYVDGGLRRQHEDLPEKGVEIRG